MTNHWQRLRDHHAQIKDLRIAELLDNPSRAPEFSARHGEMLFDFSKTGIDVKGLAMLLELAQSADVGAKRDAMFAGAQINETEGRAVLHTALRNLQADVVVDGENVMPEVRATHARMADFARALRDGKITGQGGAYTDVVNIGIGGSDLGPAMAYIALAPYADGPRCHFVSNWTGPISMIPCVD